MRRRPRSKPGRSRNSSREATETQLLNGWELALASGVIAFVTIMTLVALFVFFRRMQSSRLLETTIDRWIEELQPQPDSIAAVVDQVATRRYEFLTFYGQFVLTALVVALITLLLVSGAVTAEAGLPVLATILGIVFGKAVVTRRALPERPPGDQIASTRAAQAEREA